MTFTPRRANSGPSLAMYPSSVVQTGVKSFGCENSTAHELPIQSWKLIGPSVVSALKSGAVSPICKVISLLLRSNAARLPSAEAALPALDQSCLPDAGARRFLPSCIIAHGQGADALLG